MAAETEAARAVVLDIEGTTTPITFVHEVLFPYAVAHAPAYLDAECAAGGAEAIELAQALLREAADLPVAAEGEGEAEGTLAARASAAVRALVAADRKSAALKELQGRLWRRGFEAGALRAPHFPDVVEALQRWRGAGALIYIYSSGSEEAQRLLFRYTASGDDLTRQLTGHYDLVSAGSKLETASYERIGRAIGRQPILFVTDNPREAFAATAAGGWRVALTERPGNAPLPNDARAAFPVVTSLLDDRLHT